MDDKVIIRFFEVQSKHLMTAQLQIKCVADTDVDHTQETLVFSLELSLVEDLHSYYGRILDHYVKTFIPVRIQSLFDDTGCIGLFAIDGDDCKGVGQTKDITLRQTIGGDNCDPDLLR